MLCLLEESLAFSQVLNKFVVDKENMMNIVECITRYKVQHILKVVAIFLACQLIFLCLFSNISAIAAPLAASSNISLINGLTHTNIISTVSGANITYAPIGNNAKIGVDAIENDLANGLSVIITTTSAGTGTQNGDLTIDNSVTLTWTTSSDLTMVAERELLIESGATISTTDGNLVLEGNPNAILIDSKFRGVLIEGRISSSGSGAIMIRGHGGDKNNQNRGIEISGQINSTGTGAISISGTGGNGTRNNHGVNISSSGQVNSTGTGVISINGTGNGSADDNHGVILSSSGQVNNTGTGTTTINGVGGNGINSNFGVSLTGNSTSIYSKDGDISVTATGGNGSGQRNTGIRLWDGGHISGTNGVNITIVGNGGSGTDQNRGIHTKNTNSGIYSANGNIQLIGTGGTGGNENVGIHLQGDSQVRASASGHGNTTTSVSGDIMITGTMSGNSSDIYIAGQGIGDNAMIGDILLIADTINFGNADGIQSAGNLLIQPMTPSRDIQIGSGITTGLQLGDSEMRTIIDGFNSITIGNLANGTGDVNIKTVTFSDTVTIAGGTISRYGHKQT